MTRHQPVKTDKVVKLDRWVCLKTHRDYAMSFFIARKRFIMKELKFKNVYGYQEIKDELNRIKSWYENEAILNNPKITLPKGILFYGTPGNGKTLFVREFIDNFDVPKFIIEGRNENTSLELKRVFEKAKKEKFAIVVIDELELLVPENSKEQRVLQQELDGVVQKGSILVLATTNHVRDVGTPLLRPGRFDRKIEVDKPNRESRREIFKHMLENLNIDISNINLEHVSKHCGSVSGAEIKAICNDVYLRCQNTSITEEEIERSYERVKNNELGVVPNTINDYRIAIHEAGHSLMTLHFKENWSFYCAKFVKNGGVSKSEEVKENFMTLEKRIQWIMIGFGGYLAEEVVFGKHDYGSWDDFETIREFCRQLVERSSYFGIKYNITESDRNADWRHETSRQRAKIERLTNKLMFRYERKVKRFLKKHIEELKRFANYMCENGSVGYRDVEKLCLANI